MPSIPAMAAGRAMTAPNVPARNFCSTLLWILSGAKLYIFSEGHSMMVSLPMTLGAIICMSSPPVVSYSGATTMVREGK